MKKCFTSLLSVTLFLSIVLSANMPAYAVQKLTYGDYTYRVFDDDTAGIMSYNGTKTNLTIPSSLDGHKVSAICGWAFDNLNVVEVTLPNTLEEIWTFAFANCSRLKSINIPNGVKTIENKAFENCTALESVTIPKSVTSIGALAFRWCTSLTQINVSSSNNVYSSINGVVYNKRQTHLIIYPYGKTNVTFSIPVGVVTIKEYAFSENVNLKSVTIPSTVKYIRDSAFRGCENITKVYYESTVLNWNNILIYFGNELINDVIVYNDSLNHKWSLSSTKKATITANGYQVYKCTTCSKTRRVITYSPSNIFLSNTSYTYDGKVKKPSVTVKNIKGTALTKDTHYTVAYQSGRINVGEYTVTVDLIGKFSGTVNETFKIIPKGTEISSLSARSKGFTVKWKKQATQTTGYQIQYSTSSNFTGSKTVTVSPNTTTSNTVSNLSSNQKYYVRVRTYKIVNSKRYYSSWSSAKYVTTK